MGYGLTTGIGGFAALISAAYFAIGIFVLVLVIKLLMKANTAIDLWIKNNSNKDNL